MIKILYHADCPDGFGAAWAAWSALRAGATYIPVHHGEPPPRFTKLDNVFLLDFAYKRDVLLELRRQANSVTVIDHHKTAMEDLAGLPDCHFDMDRSGAVLAWEYFHKNASAPPRPRPGILDYIQDRDLWAWKLPHSREICLALDSFERTFEQWDGLPALSDLAQIGEHLLRDKKLKIVRAAEHAYAARILGHDVHVVNATENVSDVCDFLCRKFPNEPFSAYYFDMPGDVRKWGLRSRSGFDVSEIAKRMGGGGHRAAAGFQTTQGWTGDEPV